jgi:hypothetical protein
LITLRVTDDGPILCLHTRRFRRFGADRQSPGCWI